LEEIGQNAMPLDQLLAVIGESDASRWERMGPVVMCLRASQIEREAYPASMSGVIVGWTMWEEQGMAGIWAVFNGGSVSAIAGKDLRDEAERSIAFNESIGIPMPEEIVEELRGAMGGR
jgi:hypothetical protein